MFDRSVERLLHPMIAWDEGWIDRSHCLSARAGLKRLGHDIARNTIKTILKDHGVEPAPERGAKTPCKTFLAAHWDGLAAADFFTVEVLTLPPGRVAR